MIRRISAIMFAAVIVISSSSGIVQGQGRWNDEKITISPKVLVLDYSGTRITIHTDITASEVAGSSVLVEVNGYGPIEPCSVFADLCGDLVVKFEVVEAIPYVQPPRAEITLKGEYLSGGSFSATGTIIVK